MDFHLRQQDPQTLTAAQLDTIKVERNFTTFERPNQASSSRTNSEPKKSIVNMTSFENETLPFLVDDMKRMEVNFTKLSNRKIKLYTKR